MSFHSLQNLVKKISIIFALSIFLFIFTPLDMTEAAQPVNVDSSKEIIVEHLRLHVPKEFREAWLSAEKDSWAPWLSKQKGFVSRQLFWDESREEATLLISWSSRSEWKNISQLEIDSVQKRFEQIARNKTGISKGNPFPLIFEGELIVQ